MSYQVALRLTALLLAFIMWPATAESQQTQFPNLVVGTVRLEPASGSCFTPQNPQGLRIVVTNSGTAPTGPFAVDVNGQRQQHAGLGVSAAASFWFPNPSTNLNNIVVDALRQVGESNEADNAAQPSNATLLAQTGALAPAPACAATSTATSTSTRTATPTSTPTITTTPTSVLTLTSTPTITPTGVLATNTPTSLPATATPAPAAGVQYSISPARVRLRPGETIAVTVRVDWNPTNANVDFSLAAADAISAPLAANAQWSPTRLVQGNGVTGIILGTSSTLSPGIYALNVTATTPMGSDVRVLNFDVIPSPTLFESEILRRNEYMALGPEMLPPYRGGDSFFYQPRVNALLQWRPDTNTYVNANTSELLDTSAIGPSQYRLPQTIKDDGTAGNLNASRKLRLEQWLTDPVIARRYRAPPPGVTGPWDENGSVLLYGLPVSKPTQIGPYIVQRFQRAVFRHWIADTPAHPEWRDSVAVIPLEQAALNFMPEIDPIAAGEIVRASRGGQPPAFTGFWELDGASANGFAGVALEAEDAGTGRVSISNPTDMWLEATLIGPAGTQAELAPGQLIVSDWPGLPPLSWILRPGERMILHVHPNQVHPEQLVRNSSVYHVWVRPTARAAMARVTHGMAGVGLPELGDLQGSRLTAYYRNLLTAASQSGGGIVGCLTALDGDVNAGDERQFLADLRCATGAPITGYVMAQAAASIGTGVDPAAVSGRLNAGAILGRIGDDPATGWFFWNLQLDGREPGGRIQISYTGAAAGG